VSSPLWALVGKELLELRRDRRVLIMGVFLPILLYPLLMGFTSRLERKQEQEQRQKVLPIALVGELPGLREALSADEGLVLHLEVPADSLAQAVRQQRVQLGIDASEGWAQPGASEAPTLQLFVHTTRDESREARRRVEAHLDSLRMVEVQRRYVIAGGQQELLATLPRDSSDLASESAAAGAGAGRMLVYVLLWSLFSGGAAFATDMVAGEKERGTLETLFLLPVQRSLVARSKLVVVTLGTILTAILNLASLTYTYRMGWVAGEEGEPMSIGLAAVAQTALLVLPLAVLMAGVLLSISAFARSLKEAQYYVLPVMLVMFVPALLSMSQTVKLNPLVALIPVANVAFAMRDAMLGQSQAGLLALVVVSTLAYAAMLLRWVTSMLADETKVLGFDPEPIFARSPGGRRRALHLAMALSILAFFYVGQFLQARYEYRGLLLSLWVVLPLLAIGVLLFVRRDGRIGELLSLRLPPPQAWLAAPLLALGVMWPLVDLLFGLQSRFLPMPETDLQAMQKVLGERPLWQLFVAGAVSPAVCEELLFRGVCFGLLLRLSGPRRALIFSSIYFALMHLSVFRLVPTFLLGAIMALLVLRSASLWPAMLFHLVYNGGLLIGSALHEQGRLPIPVEGPVVWAASVVTLLIGGLLLRSCRAEHGSSG
jgi:sodium transport system permease protein